MKIQILALTISSIVLGSFFFSQPSYSESEDEIYKAPLRQIRDDGIHPSNVICNEGKVLFFKISNKMPICIFEKSIDRFTNNWIGWYGTHNETFLNYYDHEYLQEKNSMLDRNTIVSYALNPVENIVVSKVKEVISNIDNNSVIYDPLYREGAYEIVDENSNDPIDWKDPRTSIQYNRSAWLASGKIHDLVCDEELVDIDVSLSKESSFKILKNFTGSIFLNYNDKILIQENKEGKEVFSHSFISQGITNFEFDDNLSLGNWSEKVCSTNLLPKVYLYEITIDKIGL